MRSWAVLLAVALIVTLAGFIGGRSLGRKQSESLAFNLEAPSYDGATLPAARSVAGFIGFEPGSGLDGGVLITGSVVSAGDGAIVLDTMAGRQSIRISGNRSLRHLQPASLSDLAPGARVVVIRGSGQDEAAAILIVAGD